MIKNIDDVDTLNNGLKKAIEKNKYNIVKIILEA
jgi:hypothetical protein